MENKVTWRIRYYDTGEISCLGPGFFDIISKIGSKLTGKTASRLASKAAEKCIEKGAEKTGEVLGEKIYKFSSKLKNQPIQTHETKGEIVKLLKSKRSLRKFKINSSLLKTFIIVYYEKCMAF